jgi:hypothetical protein
VGAPASSAAGDGETSLRQQSRERAAMRQPGGTGAARTDNRDLRVQQQAGVSRHEQRGGRLRDVFQLWRKILVGASQQPMTRHGQPGQIGSQARFVRLPQPGLRLLAEFAPPVLQRVERRADVAVGRIQPLAQATRAKSRRAQGNQPRTQFILVFHALQFRDSMQKETARWWPRRAVGVG